MLKKIQHWCKMLMDNPRRLAEYLLGKKSYSQTGEDLILSHYLTNKEWCYVDVGANHPSIINNTYLFYKKGWRGINIEPNVILHKNLKRKRKRDINLNIWIGESEGNLEFYTVDPHTLSTFDKEAAEQYKKQGHKVSDVTKVPILPLSEVFEKYLGERTIDFMSVDTEGFDMQVLKSNDWDKYKPGFIVLETIEYSRTGGGKKINQEYDSFLEEKGYMKFADTYINTIYLEKQYGHKIGLL